MRTTDKIEKYAAKIDGKLRADEQATDSMRVFTSSYVGRILKDCGYKKRGSRNLALIQAALVSRHVYPDPPLTTPSVHWEQQVHFTRRPPSGRPELHRVRFPAERDLETFLVANFDYLFPDMKLLKHQYPVQSGYVDILATDRDGYVVIELKKVRPGDRLVNQLPRYMDDVAEADISKGGTGAVRGLVVAPHLDLPMHGRLAAIAAEKGRRVDWWQYEVEFEMQPAPPPVPWSEPIMSNGEPWTEAGVVNPDSPARNAVMTPYDAKATQRALGLLPDDPSRERLT